MRITPVYVLGAGVLAIMGMLATPARSWAGDGAPPSPPTVAELMTRDVVGMPGKQVTMITVSYLPGGASMAHRHDAQVFVYVLEGAMTMQVDGSAPVTVGPGQTFYEGPHDVHRVSANASQTVPAKILVSMLKDKARPASRPVARKDPP